MRAGFTRTEHDLVPPKLRLAAKPSNSSPAKLNHLAVVLFTNCIVDETVVLFVNYSVYETLALFMECLIMKCLSTNVFVYGRLACL